MKNILFMGSLGFSVPLLDYLRQEGGDSFSLAGIVTQPDKAVGRGRKVRPNVLAEYAETHGIQCLKPEKPRDEVKAFMEDNAIDLVLVMAYGHIIRQSLLDIPPLGMLNFHVSILPKYRGATPMPAAIAEGDRVTGVTLTRMVKKMDAGPVLDVIEAELSDDETVPSLSEKLGGLCPELMRRNMGSVLDGSAEFEEQDHSQASYCRKIEKADAWMDFGLSAAKLECLARAYGAWSLPYFEYQGERIKVGDLQVIDGQGVPGEVMGVDGALVVGTGDGLLSFGSLQRPGGRLLPALDFLRGFPIEVGTQLGGNPDYRPLVTGGTF